MADHTHDIDQDRLMKLIDDERHQRGLTWSQVASQVGVSHNTISMHKLGKTKPTVETFASLLMWLNPLNPGAIANLVIRTRK